MKLNMEIRFKQNKKLKKQRLHRFNINMPFI